MIYVQTDNAFTTSIKGTVVTSPGATPNNNATGIAFKKCTSSYIYFFLFAVVEITAVSIAGELQDTVEFNLDRESALLQLINAYNADSTINTATFNGNNQCVKQKITNASLANANASYIFTIY